MDECDICKREIITCVGSRWDQTGVEFPWEGHEDKSIKLCWECYYKFMEDNKE